MENNEQETQHKEAPSRILPEDAPALADWIEEELGDTELAEFLRAHQEKAGLLTNGESILPRTVFDVVEDLVDVKPALAQEFVYTLDQQHVFPELSYQKGVGNVAAEEITDAGRERKFIVAQDRISFREGEVDVGEVDRSSVRAANIALS